MLTLVAVPVEEPRKGSARWTFRVENLLGMTMGRVTVVFKWKRDAPCFIPFADYSLEDQMTRMFINLDPPRITKELNYERKEECPEDMMECVTFRIEINFVGPFNNIPYINWLRVCAESDNFTYG